jgi:hypothetical protein
MNKRDFAGLAVRAVGIWMIASGLVPFIWISHETFSLGLRRGFLPYAFAVPLTMFLSIAIGLHLTFKGSWIADKLVQVDDTTDL